jgi:protein tyrosine/serine phosphatase
MDRWLELDGAVNVRDLGGLPTEDGRAVKSGLVLRSDNLQGLSDKDVRRLVEDYRLRTVVDLRTPAEVDGEGPGPLVAQGLRHVNLNLIPGWNPKDHTSDRVIPDEGREHGDVSHHYIHYLDEASAEVTQALRVLADDATGPAVVHCAAGKDRTGVVCALALVVAGVPREAVVADYALTGERIELIYERLLASPTYASGMSPRSIDDMRPHGLSMRHFLDRLDERGGPLVWLADKGFGPDEQAALRARLVA